MNDTVIKPEVAPAAVVAPTEGNSTIAQAIPAPAVVEAPAAVVEAPVAAQTVLAEAIDKNVQAPKTDVKPQDSTPLSDPKASAQATADGVKTTTEGGQSDEPAPPPQYEPFKLPEGVILEAERTAEFTNLLADLEVRGKADHALVQEFGQKAVEFHLKELERATTELNKFYQTSWDRQKLTWKDQFLQDTEIGGNRSQTTVDLALSFIRTHGGTEAQQTEFRNVMESSGLGNHPAVIRLLANAGRVMSEGKPLAAPKPVPNQPKSKLEAMYGSQGKR